MRVYLDHHAATPPCTEARAAMDAAREDAWSNPSSVHARGRAAKALLERARRDVAAALAVDANDVVFTSGGTEACQLGVMGLGVTRHVLSTKVEHPAVAASLDALARRGVVVDRLEVPSGAPPSPEALDARITRDTELVAVQWINHETGTVFPVTEYGRVCRDRGVALFVDATQALGKVDVSGVIAFADLVALTGTKMGGPSGAGALYVRRGLDVSSVILGGAQERGRRAGTQNVLACVGFGAACAASSARVAAMGRVSARRETLEQGACALGAVVNGAAGQRVATVTNVSFRGLRSDTLVAALDLEGVEVSAGAACSSGVATASPVLRAMHADEPWRAESALRMSLSVDTRDDEVDFALVALQRVLARAKKI